MRTQMQKAEAFRALHARPGAFIIPNPWEAGTAKLLAAMGFEALATTSLGLANMLGRPTVSLDAIIDNCRVIAEATDLPVNADLENCGADDPKTAAKAIARAADAGVVGGSIEDSTGDRNKPMKTWKNLYTLLDGAGLDTSECFFTNVFVGLVRGANPLAGVRSSAASPYRKWCRDFLEHQAQLQQMVEKLSGFLNQGSI